LPGGLGRAVSRVRSGAIADLFILSSPF
jgi:hypothetical protein